MLVPFVRPGALVRHLFLIANIVTTSKALVTSSVALVSSSFLLLLVRHLFTRSFLFLVAWHLLLPA